MQDKLNEFLKKTIIVLAIAPILLTTSVWAKTTSKHSRKAVRVMAPGPVIMTPSNPEEKQTNESLNQPIQEPNSDPAQSEQPQTVTLPEQVRAQAPGYYRMMIGKIQVTALYDGTFDFNAQLLKNVQAEKVNAALSHHYGSIEGIQTAVNAYLIHTGDHLVLIDAGCGALFGEKQGRIIENLKASGYTPEQVDTIILTHLHGDHTGGLSNKEGTMLFPNAKIYANRIENEYWLSEKVAAAAPVDRQIFFKLARASTVPYLQADKWHALENGDEVIPGIFAVATYGHTPGHTAYLISSEGKKMLIWGDIVHSHVLQFAQPDIAIEYDSDTSAAVMTRRRLLAEVSAEKRLVAGMHLPFPGIGYVRDEGNGRYSWIPVEYMPIN